jgi:putative drug exporter of the RND superfamily
VALLVAGHLAGTMQVPTEETGSGQTGQAQQMMSRDFPLRANEYVLFESGSLQVSAPAYQAAIRDVLDRIQATGRVTQIRSPLVPAYANQISANRHAALLQLQLTGNIVDDATRVVPVLAAVQAAAGAHPQIKMAETGDATINKAVNDTIFRDLRRAEMLSFPITLVVLLIALRVALCYRGWLPRTRLFPTLRGPPWSPGCPGMMTGSTPPGTSGRCSRR